MLLSISLVAVLGQVFGRKVVLLIGLCGTTLSVAPRLYNSLSLALRNGIRWPPRLVFTHFHAFFSWFSSVLTWVSRSKELVLGALYPGLRAAKLEPAALRDGSGPTGPLVDSFRLFFSV